ncbi:MAG: bifunctional (p)ppGpp synthetase/guanosine-3',5'-bis(diphosphate) 3'-pyrophosphohydrolase [Desulfamplus sp.]|nr:bifunctional (p)ppGpp synthetase/guanosine-3',5'-bis(diphosphate) 3'-pyrophosphohydrolase [Desulfamplus sp.]
MEKIKIEQLLKEPLFIEQIKRSVPLDKYSHVVDICCQPTSDGQPNLVLEALEFAFEHHAGQRRKSGEPYITHPIAVAEIVAGTLELKDPELIAATILHDIVEDVSFLTTFNIEKRFGKNVAAFVDGCTKLNMMSLDKSINKDMTYQKLILMASEHPEILLIKFADRIHNLMTISSLKEHKRQRIAQETIEVYGPLAEKLGLFSVKRILFDLALRQRFPSRSKRLLSILRGEENSTKINEIKDMINSVFKLPSVNIYGMPFRRFPFNVTVTSRLKNLYAFYSCEKGTLDIDNAENLVDFTVVLDTEDILECYKAMGMIARTLAVVPKTIRDYIANPKANGYKSLHLRVVHKDRRYLVKIRTREMERVARKGLLLHWDDPENTMEYRKGITDILKSIGEYQGSPVNRKNMIRQLTEDDKIFVVTPKGDFQYLPTGSIVLDFAYKVHSWLGDRCARARVNNQIVSRGYVLKDGDVVEIITSDEPIEISADIEGRCKTPKARSAVNRQIQKKRDMFARDVGRSIMSQAVAPEELFDYLINSSAMPHFLTYKGYENIDQLFTSIGQSIDMPREVLWEINGRKDEHRRFVLSVSDIERDIHKFSQCCKPLPGLHSCLALLNRDGISFHRDYCDKYKQDREYALHKMQIMDVVWDMDYLWKIPLTFNIKLIKSAIKIIDIINIISSIPFNVDIHLIRESTLKNCVDISVSFQRFNESSSFFSCFAIKDYNLEIQDYGRYEFMMGRDF